VVLLDTPSGTLLRCMYASLATDCAHVCFKPNSASRLKTTQHLAFL
jgi:hypothetical protein